MPTDFQEKIRDLTEDVHIAMLTTMTDDGRHVSRPMAVQHSEDNADLWFFTYESSDKVAQARRQPQVNVAFSNDKKGAWVSVAGTAEVVHDKNKVDELWNPMLKAWFPDGQETPGLTLIKVSSESAEYWDSPSSKVATAISLAKSIATGKSAAGNLGDNESGEL